MLIIEITDIRVQKENPLASKSSTSGKAAIISRMAKMGQSILPKMPLPSTTDSEDTEVLLLTFSIVLAANNCSCSKRCRIELIIVLI